jgi:hypothetical protein
MLLLDFGVDLTASWAKTFPKTIQKKLKSFKPNQFVLSSRVKWMIRSSAMHIREVTTFRRFVVFLFKERYVWRSNSSTVQL